MMVLWYMSFPISSALAQSGSVDSSFKPGFNDTVFSILVQPDGKLLVSGFFTKIGNANRSGVARINADASLDNNFNPGSGATSTNGGPHTVFTLALQRDGRVILGGRFQKFDNLTRSYIARLNNNGSLDASFAPVVDGPDSVVVAALAVQPDEKILIGGEFTSINGTQCNHIARLNPDGSLDTTFDPGIGVNASIQEFALQTNGAVIIGGQFSTVNGATRVRVARLNANGSLDNTFDLPAVPNNN